MNEKYTEQLKTKTPNVIVDPAPGSIFPIAKVLGRENALVVSSYPYGGRRCIMLFYYEDGKRGTRLVQQTNDPKVESALIMNAPKKSTYWQGLTMVYVDDNGHIHEDVLNMHKVYEGSMVFKTYLIDDFAGKYGEAFTEFEWAYITGLRKLIADKVGAKIRLVDGTVIAQDDGKTAINVIVGGA